MARYAISDIHGCALTFQRMVEEKLQVQQGDTLFLLGDYINRGPNSKGVLDYIFRLQQSGIRIHALRGNHEDVLLKALYSKALRRNFLLYGGESTLQSFQVKKPSEIPDLYIDFLRTTHYYVEVENLLLVHAGFNFRATHFLDDREAMLWIRDTEVDLLKLGDRYIIHGHTPTSKDEIRRQFMALPRPRVLNIDAGCVYHKRIGTRLCALNLDTFELTFSRNVDVAK